MQTNNDLNPTSLQAMDKRNSFAKTVYSMLFSWLVDKINLTIAPTDQSLRGL